MTDNNKPNSTEATPMLTFYTAIGICLGIVVGVLTDNVGSGISLGLCLGAGVGYAIFEERL